jgi:hypothetical protein
MAWSSLGLAGLGKPANQVNTQTQGDDLKHVLQKAIAKLWPQAPGQENHNQSKDDAQHQMDWVGRGLNRGVFAHGLCSCGESGSGY